MIRPIHSELFPFLLTDDSAAILSEDEGEVELCLVSLVVDPYLAPVGPCELLRAALARSRTRSSDLMVSESFEPEAVPVLFPRKQLCMSKGAAWFSLQLFRLVFHSSVSTWTSSSARWRRPLELTADTFDEQMLSHTIDADQ